jgi:LuxR family maltose regulon positive regulatory protein
MSAPSAVEAPARRDLHAHAPARSRPPAAYHVRHAHAAQRRGVVARPRLLARLLELPRPLALLVAPAGFGKTTLLAQWRADDPRRFAWLSLQPRHDEPAALAAAVDAALAGFPVAEPYVLVLDNAETLRSAQAAEVVAGLVEAAPQGTTIGLASRREPGLPLGRLRAQDDVVELRADRLALTQRETEEILRRSDVNVAEDQLARLLELTEGWPAALQLVLRAARELGDPRETLDAIRGDDRTIADYLREEALCGLDGDQRAFLRRSSVMTRVTPEACDAMLERTGSGPFLARLAAVAPLVPLDSSHLEYRHHPLVAQALRAELRSVEPALERQLHLRLSDFYDRAGEFEPAIEHAVCAADPARAGALLAFCSGAYMGSGRADLLDSWLPRLDQRAVLERPSLALAAAAARFAAGDCDAAQRWAETTLGEPGPIGARARLLRVASGRAGIGRMAAAARAAANEEATPGPWLALACLIEGTARLLLDDADAARRLLEEGARHAISEAPLIRALCLGELALHLLESGRPEEAIAVAAKARGALALPPAAANPLGALTLAACSLVNAHHGALDASRSDLREAAQALDALPDPPPWFGALTGVLLARVHLKLSDPAAARQALSEASRLRWQNDDAPALRRWLDDTWGLADDYAAGPVACPATLTLAELRVLRLLPTHLTFREIAGRLHVSANTIKTQAHAVYRKLDASSRSEAVAHAAALGLIEG